MRRWSCPTCGGSLNAPEKLAPDDVRRYCLPCSEGAGKLVERIVPALAQARLRLRDAKRRRREELLQEEAHRVAFRRLGRQVTGRALPFPTRPLMLADWELWRRRADAWGRVIEIHLRVVVSLPSSSAWHCGSLTGAGTYEVPLFGNVFEARARLLHALAHAARPDLGHGKEFWRFLADATGKIVGVAEMPPLPRGFGWSAQQVIVDAVRFLGIPE